jgi:hypothetical protein
VVLQVNGLTCLVDYQLIDLLMIDGCGWFIVLQPGKALGALASRICQTPKILTPFRVSNGKRKKIILDTVKPVNSNPAK